MRRAVWLSLAVLALQPAAVEARAGYAHYFVWTDKPDDAKLAACVADMKRIVEAAKETLAGPDGDSPPVVAEQKLQFNGRAKAAQEPFIFPGNRGPNACETRSKPYDAAVTACLIVARDHFTPSELAIGSDGQWSDPGWQDGAKLYQQVLGRAATNPITGMEDDSSDMPGQPMQPEGWSPLGVAMLVGLVGVILWIILRPHYEFIIFITRSRVDRVRGDAPRPFLMEVDDICREFSIPRGTIRRARVAQWGMLLFSREIPPDCRQRIKNVWTAHWWRAELRRRTT